MKPLASIFFDFLFSVIHSFRQVNKQFLFILLFYGFLSSCSTNTDFKNKTNNIDPLPSWKESTARHAIIKYVEDVTDPNSTNFIEVKDRIATFDNDGTLWSEQPVYFQLFFVIDRVKTLAPDHPEWKNQQPYKAILENDMTELSKQGMNGLMEIVMTTHAGMTEEEFNKTIEDWITKAHHPTKDKLYTELVFQPMLELLAYLQSNDFKTFIVSGGGVDFMRPWAEDVYNIPKNQIIGSTTKIEYDYNGGSPVIRKVAELEFIDDREGKPVGIQKHIGRKPVFAVGNSDGDLQMLRWAESNSLKSFMLYVHHTDSVREWSYDRTSHIGKLDLGLDEAIEKDWTIVDMKNDWEVIYPFETK